MADNRNLLTGFLFKRGQRRGAASLIKDRPNDASDVVLDSWLFDVPAGGTNYTLTALHGTYSLTGQTATVYRNRSLTASVGSYAVSGQSATLLKSKLLIASNGLYSIAGQSADLAKATSYILEALHGSYSVSGQSATLLKSRVLDALNGNYEASGQSADIARSREIVAQSGAYSITGQAVGITRDRALEALNGSYEVAGQQATLTVGGVGSYELVCLHGTYSVSGNYVTPGYWADGYVEGTRITVFRPEPVTPSPKWKQWEPRKQSKRETEEDRIKLGIIEVKQEKSAIAKQANKAEKREAPKEDIWALKLHEALLAEQLAKLEADLAIERARQAAQLQDVRMALAAQHAARLIELRQAAIDADLVFVMSILAEV